MDYEVLLERAEEKISKELTNDGRFKIPDSELLLQGKSTIIVNFFEISDTLGRDPKHLLKYLSKQLAASGEISGKQAKFIGKFNKKQIESKIDSYAKDYVFCPVCGKPDTKIVSEEGIRKMKCEACGSKRFVKKL